MKRPAESLIKQVPDETETVMANMLDTQLSTFIKVRTGTVLSFSLHWLVLLLLVN